MGVYNKVLIALDTTEEADEVVGAASEIALQEGAELHLLTVVKPIHYAYTGYENVGMYSGFQSFEAEAQAAAMEKLQERAQRLGQSEDQVAVIIGKPSAVIKEHAETLGVDLIVMGSHGRHGLGLLLGSTANGVLHGAPCDVLTVRISG